MESSTTAIVPTAPAELAQLGDIEDQARAYVQAAKAANTRRAYAADWRDFTTWCEMAGLPALPAAPETVTLYVTARAETSKVSTLQRRLIAISQAHQASRLESPTKSILVRETMKGIRRVKGTAQEGKAPTLTADIRAMVTALPSSSIGMRDRALLLLGFAGAFRRSELVALDVADLQFNRQGVVVTLRRSKTDQEGQGRAIGIPHGSHVATCPVKALRAWLKVAGIDDGPIFRPVNRHGHIALARLSAGAVAEIVKRRARAAGLDPANYAGHSLRAGLATSAAAAGVSERAIMAQTGHRSVAIARRYIREGSLFRENAAAAVGL
ncbi:MAG TPA: site-specific integrase [Herpetosiphonaceae bacterium]|nr:site-specific integrase [Herpetosiphonaceae bacterium]